MPEMIRSSTILQVSDVVASEAFYREKLGFDPGNFWGDPPCFCIVGHGRVTLFLDQTREEGTQAPVNQYWAAYTYIDDADAYHAELKSRGVDIVRPPEDTEYGCRDFDVKDPDGHIIAFSHDLTPGPQGPGL